MRHQVDGVLAPIAGGKRFARKATGGKAIGQGCRAAQDVRSCFGSFIDDQTLTKLSSASVWDAPQEYSEAESVGHDERAE